MKLEVGYEIIRTDEGMEWKIDLIVNDEIRMGNKPINASLLKGVELVGSPRIALKGMSVQVSSVPEFASSRMRDNRKQIKELDAFDGALSANKRYCGRIPRDRLLLHYDALLRSCSTAYYTENSIDDVTTESVPIGEIKQTVSDMRVL